MVLKMTRLLGALRDTSVQLVGIIAWAAWVLRSVQQDYERRGQLSNASSLSAWGLYLTHLGLTISSSLSPAAPLPVSKKAASALGLPISAFGVILFAAGVREFRSFDQMSGFEKGSLVKTGPYRYSRNPQVVGWLLALLGTAIAGRSSKALMLVVSFYFVHRLYFAIEERHLGRSFGEEYRRYYEKTPRLLGLAKAS